MKQVHGLYQNRIWVIAKHMSSYAERWASGVPVNVPRFIEIVQTGLVSGELETQTSRYGGRITLELYPAAGC